MVRCASVGLIFLAGACFVIGAIAVAIPFWGQFRNRVVQETGHFGPWTVCRDIDYGRKLCGPRVVMFKPMFVVYAAGVCSAVGVAALGAFGLVNILYMTTQCSPQSSLRRHKVQILISQLILSLSAALMTWTAVGLFATQGDDLENGYIISIGISFYLEIVVGLFSTILMLLTIGEYVTARREPPELETTPPRTEIGMKSVITNPMTTRGRGGPPRSSSKNGIAVTRSSGLPYVPSSSSNRYKYNGASNNHFQGGGSGRRKTPPSGRRSGGSRSRSTKPFAKDLPSPTSWNGSVTTSPPESTVNGGSTVSDYSSVSTISTVVSNNPLSRAGPLRSSLKKTRVGAPGSDTSGFGISNPGFSGSSPTLSRTSSVKKVRIQSPMDVSTDV